MARSRDTLLAAWRRAGYLDARVRPEVAFSEARDEARVSLVVEPGPRTIVEHVVLSGLGRTQPAAVEREMVLRPGEPFSFERVLESQRRLSGLGIFERVSIAELDPERERRRDVVVSVQEAPRTSWSWGVGWSEQDRLRGSVELTRRNLGGLGRTASVFARGSFRGQPLPPQPARAVALRPQARLVPDRASGRRRTARASTTTARAGSCRPAARSTPAPA